MIEQKFVVYKGFLRLLFFFLLFEKKINQNFNLICLLIKDKLNSSAPLATSETFENLEDLNTKKPGRNLMYYSQYDCNSAQENSFASLKKPSLKVKLNQLLTPPSTQQKQMSTAQSSGILKSLFNSKSSTSREGGRKEPFDRNPQLIQNDNTNKNNLNKKKLIPDVDLILDFSNSSSNTNSPNSTSVSSSNSSLDDFQHVNASRKHSANSFNALNITNSPRLTKNSRMAKLNLKRQQNEEKRLEKQRHDKRLRMSQEIQRKLNEIHAKTNELEREGNHLEILIGNDTSSPRGLERKLKLEQELYNIIHQRNLLTRCENELNIQSRALAIEDKLSECKQKLRETINLPGKSFFLNEIL